ncbi:hypothetical protein P389DRAFT_169033 [Cystobasidium minutum MCA 4210]|uniref:uncharacterized protein n=1 Tax=Cystobasidium minutum MCA 4210 TaxID=1397322 RepID=UPI0034CDC889|eukprot:jgi/Rhomi1/169033/fgenesh1_kg.3_\
MRLNKAIYERTHPNFRFPPGGLRFPLAPSQQEDHLVRSEFSHRVVQTIWVYGRLTKNVSGQNRVQYPRARLATDSRNGQPDQSGTLYCPQDLEGFLNGANLRWTRIDFGDMGQDVKTVRGITPATKFEVLLGHPWGFTDHCSQHVNLNQPYGARWSDWHIFRQDTCGPNICHNSTWSTTQGTASKRKA